MQKRALFSSIALLCCVEACGKAAWPHEFLRELSAPRFAPVHSGDWSREQMLVEFHSGLQVSDSAITEILGLAAAGGLHEPTRLVADYFVVGAPIPPEVYVYENASEDKVKHQRTSRWMRFSCPNWCDSAREVSPDPNATGWTHSFESMPWEESIWASESVPYFRHDDSIWTFYLSPSTSWDEAMQAYAVFAQGLVTWETSDRPFAGDIRFASSHLGGWTAFKDRETHNLNGPEVWDFSLVFQASNGPAYRLFLRRDSGRWRVVEWKHSPLH